MNYNLLYEKLDDYFNEDKKLIVIKEMAVEALLTTVVKNGAGILEDLGVKVSIEAFYDEILIMHSVDIESIIKCIADEFYKGKEGRNEFCYYFWDKVVTKTMCNVALKKGFLNGALLSYLAVYWGCQKSNWD